MSFSDGGATFLVPIALLGFPVFVLALFASLGARKAALWSFLLGFLFLPNGGYVALGLPEYTKETAVSLSVLLASILLDGARPLRTRPSWVDLPMLVWCTSRIATSVSNDLGLYDGLSTSLVQILGWGVPYWLGRTYFSDRQGLLELARGIVIGGLLYLPLCLWEIRTSPQLHSLLYGFSPVRFYMVLRYGGYRPMVFMSGSLMVAMWMATATVICTWLSGSGALKRIAGVPTRWLALALGITTVLCKGFGAFTLMFIGIGIYLAARVFKQGLPLILMLALVASYPVVRGTGILSAERILGTASLAYDELRLQSLEVRVTSEDLYIDHAAQRPLLGWGGWGRGEANSEEKRSVPDGLWVIALSRAGWLAVMALLFMYLLPVFLFVRRYRAGSWTRPELAPLAAFCVMMTIYWIDCLANAFPNLILILMMGATHSWFANRRSLAEAAAPTVATSGKSEAAGEAKPASLARGLSRRRRLLGRGGKSRA
jgi:hypothetical protein